MRTAATLTDSRREFLSILDFDHDDARAPASSSRRDEGGAGGAASARAAARRAARRAALREASLRTRSTFQIAVRELGGDVIEPPARRRARRTRVDRRRRAQPRALGLRAPSSAPTRRTGSSEFADAAPRLRVVNALTNEEHPCQALADCLTLQRALGQPARPDDRVRRRRQQRRDLARAGGRHARRSRPRRVARRLRTAARACATASRHRTLGGDARASRPIRSPACAAPTPSTPTCGRRWDRKARRRTGTPVFASVPGERRADGARAGRTRCSCTACPRIAARKSPTTSWIRPLRRLRPGGKPPARAEGAARPARRSVGRPCRRRSIRRESAGRVAMVGSASPLQPCARSSSPDSDAPDVFEMRERPDPSPGRRRPPDPRASSRDQLCRHPRPAGPLPGRPEAAAGGRLRGGRPDRRDRPRRRRLRRR